MTDEVAAEYRYWAFISYSSKDEAHAKWLNHAIETFGVPAKLVEHNHKTPSGESAPRRLRPVFRDRDELPASSDLGHTIQDALVASRYLIVVCSPNAATSVWVNREVETFAAMGRRERILAFIVDGEPYSDGEQDCFPPALKQQEPLAADARRVGDGRADPRLKLLAGMLGVGFDALKDRERRRRMRRLQIVTAVATALVLVFAILAYFAYSQRQGPGPVH